MSVYPGRLISVLLCLVMLVGTSMTGLPVQSARAQTSNNSQGTATVLVMDVSGSMGDPWQGGIKIQSAQAAANQIIQMLDQENRLGGRHRLGVVSFSDNAMENQPLTASFDLVHSVINSLAPVSGTNIYAGLDQANHSLNQALPNEVKYMILLSDGITSGPSAAEVLSGPVQQARQAGTCIYTIGFGDPGALDEDLLRQIASGSGCGKYFYATNVNELEKIYIRIRHDSTGNVLAEFSGSVAQGETVQAGKFDVPPAQSELLISLHWPGSRMELRIHDPSGNMVTNSNRVQIQQYANLVYALVLQPMPGNWWLEVIGADLPQGPEQYSILVSGRTAPQPVITPTSAPLPPAPPSPGGSGIALLLLILGGSGVALYVYTNVLKQRRGSTGVLSPGPSIRGAPRLYFLNGPRSGQIVAFGYDAITIGRGAANQVQIPDLSVSRVHASIRYLQGYWFLQDQNSKLGTLLNGQPVAGAALKSGDRIQLGAVQMLFRIDQP
jgi:Mg-chelatase subunit ChlD